MTDLDLDVHVLQNDFIDEKTISQREQQDEYERKRLLMQEQTEKLYTIPFEIWKTIETWGQTTKRLSAYECNLIWNIAKKVNTRKEFTEAEVSFANDMLDVVLKEVPALLNPAISFDNSPSQMQN